MSHSPLALDQKSKINESSLPTLLDRFYHWEKETPEAPFLRQPIGDDWEIRTWGEAGQEIRRIAQALQALGLPERSHIALVSKNCAHWVMADLAILISGHVSVPLFPTLTADQIQHVLNHGDCKALFVGKLDNWEGMKQGIPESLPTISFPHYRAAVKIEEDRFLKWDDLLSQYKPLEAGFQPHLSDLMTICYTSGTTGKPKGTMLSYFAFARVQEVTRRHLSEEDGAVRYFSYLPMNHMAERLVVEASSLNTGGCISFAESLDTFAKNLQDTQPNVFLAVPRIWAKFQQRILEKVPQKKLNRLLKIPIIAGMTRRKIKKALGLNEASYMITGAAPMPASLLAWYHKLGLKIREGYGMTENTACCTLMPEDDHRIGTVGKPQPDCQVKIDPETGEILMKSDWVMMGYYKEPELTARVLDNGWLRTGDKGELVDGYLRITGRVKEIFKTSKGEYVAPFTLESGFALNDYIDSICVVGINLPQPIALITLSEEGKKASPEAVNVSLLKNMEDVNQEVFSYERIASMVVLPDQWTVENEIITPTLKIKRNKIEEIYASRFQEWYEEDESIIWVS